MNNEKLMRKFETMDVHEYLTTIHEILIFFVGTAVCFVGLNLVLTLLNR